MKIAVGVTVAPRRSMTVQYTLSSLKSAGFTPHVFAEPGCGIAVSQLHENRTRLGCYHNWRHMCEWLLKNTDADVILTVQDDTVFSPDSKRVLEQQFPSGDVGFVSLYTAVHYQKCWQVTIERPPVMRKFMHKYDAVQHADHRKKQGAVVSEWIYPRGVNRVVTNSLWGACALAFPRESLRLLLKDSVFCNWQGAKSLRSPPRKHRQPHEIANVDTAIGKGINRLKLPMYFVNPSCAQHIGAASTIGHDGLGGRRQAYYVRDDVPIHNPGECNYGMKIDYFILTRSAYRDDVTKGFLNRRLTLFKEVACRAIASQTVKDFTWIIRCESEPDWASDMRRDALQDIGVKVLFGRGPWHTLVNRCLRGDATHSVQVRMDDDDAIVPDFMERLLSVDYGKSSDEYYCFPNGYRYVNERVASQYHTANQFLARRVVAHEQQSVYDVKHGDADAVQLDSRPAWLWVRHRWAKSRGGLTTPTRDAKTIHNMFRINWQGLAACAK